MIKNFESFNTNESKKYEKMLAHLSSLMFNLGYEFSGNLSNVTITKNERYIFQMVIRILYNEYNFCFKNSSDKKLKDDICDSLVKYLKNVEGLKYRNYYDGSFTIIGDIDEIIKQINIEDLEVILKAKKYNV